MNNIWFVGINSDGNWMLSQATITDEQRENGFRIDSSMYIPPFAICSTEEEGLALLRTIIADLKNLDASELQSEVINP